MQMSEINFKKIYVYYKWEEEHEKKWRVGE